MARTKEEQQEGLVPVDVTSLLSPNSFDNVLAEYGITASDMSIPVPPTVVTKGFDELVELETPLFDERGNLFADINGHSGPLMFLEKMPERDSDKFTEGKIAYDGYYQWAILSPKYGKVLVSHSRPANAENKPTIAKYLDRLAPGAWFQVASFKTQGGFRVFNPVPVQR